MQVISFSVEGTEKRRAAEAAPEVLGAVKHDRTPRERESA
jgi:hypothetical protein